MIKTNKCNSVAYSSIEEAQNDQINKIWISQPDQAKFISKTNLMEYEAVHIKDRHLTS